MGEIFYRILRMTQSENYLLYLNLYYGMGGEAEHLDYTVFFYYKSKIFILIMFKVIILVQNVTMFVEFLAAHPSIENSAGHYIRFFFPSFTELKK